MELLPNLDFCPLFHVLRSTRDGVAHLRLDDDNLITQPWVSRTHCRYSIFAIAVVSFLSFVLGAASVLYLKRSSIPQDWITIVPDTSPTLFDMAVIKTDIPTPEAGKLEGRIKFLERTGGIQIGYVLKLPFKPNPVAALPAKYRKITKLENGFTIGPPEQISYTGKFTFNLQDADGFSLSKITGPDESLTAGSDNPTQGTTEATILESIAKRTKRIAVSFDAEKCNICDE